MVEAQLRTCGFLLEKSPLDLGPSHGNVDDDNEPSTAIKVSTEASIPRPSLPFEDAIAKALSTGVHGVASGLIYIAEALLLYVGAVLVARGAYTYHQMVEALALIVFAVSISLQLMAFSKFIPTQFFVALNDLLNTAQRIILWLLVF